MENSDLKKCLVQLEVAVEKMKSTSAQMSKSLAKVQKLSNHKNHQLKYALVADANQCNGVNDIQTMEFQQKWQLCYEEGLDLINKKIAEKEKLEKETKRQSIEVRGIIASRDAEVQEEYSKSLVELEDELNEKKNDLQAITAEKVKQLQEKDRLTALSVLSNSEKEKCLSEQIESEIKEAQAKLQDLEIELKEQRILNNDLKAKKTTLQKNLNQGDNSSGVNYDEIKSELMLELGKLEASLSEKCKEKETIENIDTTDFEDVQEKVIKGEVELNAIKKKKVESFAVMQSVIRALASSSGVGAIMNRIYQDMYENSRHGDRRTINVEQFLKECVNENDGKKAIKEICQIGLAHNFGNFLTSI